MADIIIGDEQPRRVYTVGATPQSIFTVPWPFLADSDVHVVINAGQADEELDLGADYTVTGAGTQSGAVNLMTPVSNCSVTVYRELVIERSTRFPAAGTLKIPSLNREFDRVVMMLQQQLDKLKRSISLAASDDLGTNATLPVAQQRAGRLFAFDVAGKPIMTNVTVAQVEGATVGSYLAGQSVGDVTGYIGDGVTTRFDTGHNLISKSSVTVTVGGVKQAPDAYAIDGQAVVLASPPPKGVKVDIRVIGVNVALADASKSPITAAGSTTARPLEERAADTINVRDYGAKGDGSTNDNTAFAAAFAVGKPVYIPAGTYRVSNLIVPAGAAIVGDGPLTVLKRRDGSGSNILNISSANVAVENLALDGNSAATVGTPWQVYIDGATDAVVRNITSTDPKAVAVHVANATRVTIEGWRFSGGTAGINVGGTAVGVVIRNNRFVSAGSIVTVQGPTVDGVDGLKIVGNEAFGCGSIFLGCAYHATWPGAVDDGTGRVYRASAPSAGDLYNPTAPYAINVEISGNLLRDGTGSGIISRAHNVTIANNIIDTSTGTGIIVQGRYTTVSGNTVKDAGSSGIDLGNAAYFSCVGNAVEDAAAFGIESNSAAFGSIAGNTVVNCGFSISDGRATGIMVHNDSAYGLYATSENVVVSLNAVVAAAGANAGVYAYMYSAASELLGVLLDRNVVKAPASPGSGYDGQRIAGSFAAINAARISFVDGTITAAMPQIVGSLGIGASPTRKGSLSGSGGSTYVSSSTTIATPLDTFPNASFELENTSSADGAGAFLGFVVKNGLSTQQRAYIGAVSHASARVPHIVIGSRSDAGSTHYQERLRIDNVGAFIHSTTSTTFVDSNGHLGMRPYTVATLPSTATAARWIYVSNESGGATPAFSDGINWRRVSDRAIVS